jgi:protein involved in polysaccharide export with SLBB domain
VSTVVARVLVFLLLFCATASCRPPATSRRASADATPSEDRTLGPGDVFEVRVFGQADLTGKYQVGPDGTIHFPFIGTVKVADQEPQQIAAEISRLLEDGQYLVDPDVSVFVEQLNSKRISVLGAVAKPGTFPLIPGMTVVQAVSQAGGFTPLASKDGTVVTRRGDKQVERYRVPVSEITRGDTDDFMLRPGDIVFVPERVF